MTEQPPQPDEAKPSRRKQIIAGLVTLIVLVIVFVGIFPQFANYEDAWDSIQSMSAWELTLLLVATIVNILVYVWPYQAALPGLTYRPAFVVRQTSFMISNTVPAGGAFGLAVQYAMLGSYGFGPARTTATIGITSVWNLFITLALPVLGVLALIVSGNFTGAAVVAAVLGVVAIGVMIGLFAWALGSEGNARRLGDLGDRLVGWFLGLFNKEVNLGLGDELVDFQVATSDVIRARWALITGTSFLQQLAQFAVLWIAIAAIQTGSEVNVAEAFAAFAFARLLTFIPITPGGLGTVDAALTGLLTAFGMDNSEALAAVLVWRAATYFPQVFLGILTFLIWRRRQSRLQTAP